MRDSLFFLYLLFFLHEMLTDYITEMHETFCPGCVVNTNQLTIQVLLNCVYQHTKFSDTRIGF